MSIDSQDISAPINSTNFENNLRVGAVFLLFRVILLDGCGGVLSKEQIRKQLLCLLVLAGGEVALRFVVIY